jgi:hypothetical protein
MLRLLVLLVFLLGGARGVFAQNVTLTAATSTLSSAGGTVTVTVQLTYTGSVSAMGLQVGSLPTGWTYGSTSGPQAPQIAPESGDRSSLGFSYISVPASPVTFSFTLNYPAGLTGEQRISAIEASFFSPSGTIQRASASPVVFAAATVNDGGAVTPTIVTPPANAVVAVGGATSFSVTATGSVPLAYQWRKDGVALAGATSSRLDLVSVMTSSAGNYSVVVSNAAGSAESLAATLTVNPATGSAPQITTQPIAQSVAEGGTATFSVVASGAGPLLYQWRKDEAPLAGATGATLTLTGVTAASAGNYSVAVSNASGSVVSNRAPLTVTPAPAAPQITTQPIAQSVNVGASVSFSVLATGAAPLAYQWRKDGAALTNATAATLAITNVQAGNAGEYSVIVSNPSGVVTSSPARLLVSSGETLAAAFRGGFFGTFDGGRGSFALFVRGDGSGVFLGYIRDGSLAVINRDVVIDSAGRFRASGAVTTTANAQPGEPARTAASVAYAIDGTIDAQRAVRGSVSGLSLGLSAPAAPLSGSTAALAGFYVAGAPGSAAAAFTIVGGGGDVFVVTTDGATADAGRGTINAAGALVVTTEKAAAIAGTVQPAGTLAASVARAGATSLSFLGANNDVRLAAEKLVNLSTRSAAGAGDASLIAGFVITGDQPIQVLVRAVGPTLAGFGVTGALARPRLELFRGNGAASVSVGSNDTWGTAANASTIASTAERVGAFALPATSADAAMLVTLERGAYTAVVTGQGSATGVGLVEMYDAATGSPLPTRKLVNLSARARAGAGDESLIAGFVIDGTLPKRVLVRGIGPTLAAFGVSEALTRTELAVVSRADNAVVAQNSGWSTSPDARAIAIASEQVGAFALGAATHDSAVLVYLAPGAYTARVGGVAGATGIALVEVYEVP